MKGGSCIFKLPSHLWNTQIILYKIFLLTFFFRKEGKGIEKKPLAIIMISFHKTPPKKLLFFHLNWLWVIFHSFTPFNTPKAISYMLRNRYYKVDIRKARSVYAVHAIFTKDTSLSSVKHPNEKKKKKRKKSLISLPRYTFILQLSHSILHGLSRSYKLQVTSFPIFTSTFTVVLFSSFYYTCTST